MVFPSSSTAPHPNLDLPPEIKETYNEARDIASCSTRGAAALLRLCIQMLCQHLKAPGKNLDENIAWLVREGLPKQIQQALDTIRVVGNNAVHPGKMDEKDDTGTVHALFGYVNIIADVMISQPQRIDALFQGSVSKSQKEAIERRDAKP